MKASEHTIRIEEDWLKISRAFSPYVKRDFKPFKVRFSELTRSDKQNNLLHGVIKQCAEKTVNVGRSKKWWKDELKNKLGRKEVHIDLDEQPAVIVVSTRDYDKKQMREFVEKIQVYMLQEYQVDIEFSEELIVKEDK